MRYLIALCCLLLVGSCSREAWRIPMAPAPDSAAGAPLVFGNGKYKFSGPVSITVQMGQGNTSTSTATNAPKAGQRGGTGAVGPAAHAQATTQPGISYWWLLLPVAGLLWWQRKHLTKLFG
jgi:hypothetical protein